MAAHAQPAPALPPARVFPQRFFDFLKSEIAPHPGMYSVFARLLVTIVITFLIVATFQMPYAAITLYSVFIIDRSSHRAAMLRAIESTVTITLGIVLALAGVMLFAEIPLLTFSWYALELWLVAFLIRTTRLPGPAMNMSLAIYSVHNVWERPYPPGLHLEQTLWVWLTLCLGFVVSVAVEFAFAPENPIGRIYEGLTGRTRALSALYSGLATGDSSAASEAQAVLAYANAGTGSIRQLVVSLRNTDPSKHQELLAVNTVTALVARLIDVTATIDPAVAPLENEALRLAALAAEVDRIRGALTARLPVSAAGYHPLAGPSAAIPSLPELERTVTMIPAAYSASESPEAEISAQELDPQQTFKIFVPDAFHNYGYVLFATKTMFAAMLCYIAYSAFDWPGLSTSVVTCLVTALNTVGATKQKQALRLTGSVAGGALALASIVFLLPEIDSITAVTLLVAAVSAFCGWFALASTRLSYFGLQTALAFYLALFQDYSANANLAPARDRALGVLLGVAMMWLVFDKLWPIAAVDHMRAGLAENMRLLARLITALDQPDRAAAIRSIRSLRDRIQAGLAAVHGHADSVLFEFGSRNRTRDLELRDAVLRLQARLRTLFVVEMAICQYRTQVVPGTRPPFVREAQAAFDDALSSKLNDIAAAVDEMRPAATARHLREAYEQIEGVVAPWAQSLNDDWVKTRAQGILSLIRQAVDLIDSLAEHCVWC